MFRIPAPSSLLFASLLTVAVAVAGASCSSSDDGTPMGDISVVLTDAAADELVQFEVDVQSIVLTRVGGDPVSVLPHATRIDFLELESLYELVYGTTVVAGRYRSMTIELDFQDASIVLAGEGDPAAVRDADGNRITGTVPVTIEFPEGARPTVRAGRNNLVVFDLQLDQSVVVDQAANEITFTPVWTVEIDPANSEPIVTSGQLQSVDFASGTFVIERRAPNGAVVDTFTVASDNATVFQLDGIVQVGDFGAGALVLHIGDRVIVQGTLDQQDRVIDAFAVEAGAGVPGNGQDWLIGHVTARTGGPGGDADLTVLGRSRDVGSGTRRFDTAHAVDVSLEATKVLRRGAGDELDTDAINVGQRVWVFGDLDGTTMDATAATGVVRLLPTSIVGVADGDPSGDTVSLDVTRFGRRDVAAFDFDVAGSVQADPDAFVVDLAGLATTNVTTGSMLRVIAWIGGVDEPGADAVGTAFVDRSTSSRLLWCRWLPPSTGVLSEVSGDVAVDVSAATTRTVVDGFGTVTLDTSPLPTITPRFATGFYSIVEDGGIEVHRSFDEFRSAVLARSAETAVRRVSAYGSFDEMAQVLAATTATVVLQ